MSTFWCDVCCRHKENLQGMRNYTGVWVSGSTNHKTSNIAGHASSVQRLAPMQRCDIERKRAQDIPQVDYSPIIQCMTRLNEDERKKLKAKFEICYYMLARESLAFIKYVPLHALSEQHGVSLGQNYKTPDSATMFTHYIAEAQRKSFLHSLATNFLSFLMDGSTDSGNLEQDVVFVVFWKKDSETQQICPVTRYLAVVTPNQEQRKV